MTDLRASGEGNRLIDSYIIKKSLLLGVLLGGLPSYIGFSIAERNLFWPVRAFTKSQQPKDRFRFQVDVQNLEGHIGSISIDSNLQWRIDYNPNNNTTLIEIDGRLYNSNISLSNLYEIMRTNK